MQDRVMINLLHLPSLGYSIPHYTILVCKRRTLDISKCYNSQEDSVSEVRLVLAEFLHCLVLGEDFLHRNPPQILNLTSWFMKVVIGRV